MLFRSLNVLNASFIFILVFPKKFSIFFQLLLFFIRRMGKVLMIFDADWKKKENNEREDASCVTSHGKFGKFFFVLQIKFRLGFSAWDVMSVGIFFGNAHKSADYCITEFKIKDWGRTKNKWETILILYIFFFLISYQILVLEPLYFLGFEPIIGWNTFKDLRLKIRISGIYLINIDLYIYFTDITLYIILYKCTRSSNNN